MRLVSLLNTLSVFLWKRMTLKSGNETFKTIIVIVNNRHDIICDHRFRTSTRYLQFHYKFLLLLLLFYSALEIVIVFPLGSSNLSIVRISMIMVSAHIMIKPSIIVTNIPVQIGILVKPTQSYASLNVTLWSICTCISMILKFVVPFTKSVLGEQW